MKNWGFKVLIGILFVTLAFGGMAMAQTTKQAKEPAKAGGFHQSQERCFGR
jgi:hypothetical protein